MHTFSAEDNTSTTYVCAIIKVITVKCLLWECKALVLQAKHVTIGDLFLMHSTVFCKCATLIRTQLLEDVLSSLAADESSIWGLEESVKKERERSPESVAEEWKIRSCAFNSSTRISTFTFLTVISAETQCSGKLQSLPTRPHPFNCMVCIINAHIINRALDLSI